MNIALLGGAFNMITLGHAEIINYVLTNLNTIDEVWVIPSYRHVYNKQMLSFEHRFNMCNLALSNNEKIKVLDYEKTHNLTGETFKLIKTLLNDKNFNKYKFNFIIGLDNANTIDKWVNYKELLNLINFIIVPRAGYYIDNTAWYNQNPHILLHHDNPIMDVSSTLVRTLLHENKDVSNYLNKNVFNYIKQHHLYS